MKSFLQTTLLRDTVASVRFLSRLPVGNIDGDELPDFRKTAHTFPLAGIIISVPGALVMLLASALGLPPLIIATLAILTLVGTTGGLHEDGLADVADGFGGGHTVTRKLEIMRDSAIGSYGTMALVFSIGLRVFSLAAIHTATGVFGSIVFLMCVGALSRASMLLPWYWLPKSRPSDDAVKDGDNAASAKSTSGLSARYGVPDHKTLLRALPFCLICLFFAILLVFQVNWLVSLIAGSLALIAITLIAKRQIGGHTGDVLGATQQMSEMGMYIGFLVTI